MSPMPVTAPSAESFSSTSRVPKKTPPVAALDPSCVWQPDKDVAAMTALGSVPYGMREFAGAIYRNPAGDYCYSLPVEGRGEDFQFKVDNSGGLQFDGIWHTHPGDDADAKLFSTNDTQVADALRRTSYIRTNDGNVRRYDPGVTRVVAAANRTSRAKTERTSPGTLVGNLTRREALEAAYDLHSSPQSNTR